MGYSVLMNTRDFPTPEQIPTPLTPIMEYNGISVEHNELGGLHNTYRTEPTETLPGWYTRHPEATTSRWHDRYGKMEMEHRRKHERPHRGSRQERHLARDIYE